jgi:predicted lactoylglutathione lyase
MGGTFDGPYELKKVFESEPNASLHFGVPGINLKSIFDFVELVLHESKNHAIPRALAYAQVGVLDLSRSRKFYDQVLGLLDMKPLFHRPTNIIYGKTNPEFFISSKSITNEPVQTGNASYVGFWADSIETVDAVYKEALACGGTSLQAPGFEDRHLYTCFIKDLDGNSLEIMKWFDDPDKPTG